MKSSADSFVSQYGLKVKVKNLFIDGYLKYIILRIPYNFYFYCAYITNLNISITFF
ncbi:hypothetical protein SAP2_19450 [Staphylococcus arlettae]|nr:hypothetical protein SAP2_19450 [Staphylococcus arlettae]